MAALEGGQAASGSGGRERQAQAAVGGSDAGQCRSEGSAVKKMLANTQPLRNLCYRMASLGDLRHRVPFEIVAESAFMASLPQN